jgi:hypothetical protein
LHGGAKIVATQLFPERRVQHATGKLDSLWDMATPQKFLITLIEIGNDSFQDSLVERIGCHGGFYFMEACKTGIIPTGTTLPYQERKEYGGIRTFSQGVFYLGIGTTWGKSMTFVPIYTVGATTGCSSKQESLIYAAI